MRRAPLALVLVLSLAGCETTADKSARLARQARHAVVAQRGLQITAPGKLAKVQQTAIVHGSEAAAAVVMVRNTSPRPLQKVPIAITVTDGRGSVVYRNDAPGLAPSLVSIPFLAAHEQVTWIDDQLLGARSASAVSAELGEGSPARVPIPRLRVTDAHQFEDPANGPSAEGMLVNASGIAQQELVVYAVATRNGRVQAAGRAVLPQAPAGASSRFQVFFVGDPRGAQLQLNAPPTTLGGG